MDDIRARLLALQQDLEADAAAGEEASGTVELDQSRVGRLSRMDAMQAQAMSQATAQRRAARLRAVRAALARVDDGEYGYCLTCEKPINEKRLEFDPTATLCIDCASKAED